MFFVVAPLFLSAIYFFPNYNYLMYHIIGIAVAIAANFEIYNIITQRTIAYPKFLSNLFGIVLFTGVYCSGLNLIKLNFIAHLFVIVVLLLLFSEFVMSFSGNFTNSISRLTAGVFNMVYPWLGFVYISMATQLKSPSEAIISFYLVVFACDSLAYLFGMLFGRRSRGVVKASPKKSLIGFFGGFLGSGIAAFVSYTLFFSAFKGKLYQLLFIAFLTASTAILGDILESILKRSAGIKDSGKIIMGRGGVLDSIDSIIASAPVFYIGYKFLIG